MNNKLHNRTLFVAALSVYLGLLIVGAPPQILAQSINSEISQKKNEQRLESSQEYFAKVEQLLGQKLFAVSLDEVVRDLNKLAKAQKFNWTESDSARYELSFGIPGNGDEPGILTSPPKNRRLTPIFEPFVTKISKDWMKIQRQIGEDFVTEYFDYSIIFEKDGLTISTKFNQQIDEQGSIVANGINSYLSKEQIIQAHNKPLKQIYENTKVSFDGNQVFIVTRLPRGSLDSLVKADEKAN